MFPNVRLMIAALVASVVALSCGFGVFAAFRVNHEPLVRLPPAAAPLQLLAGNTASVVAAAAEPFDHRFQIMPPQSAAPATDSPTPERDDRDGVESAPAASAVLPERAAAGAEEPAAVASSTETAVVAAAPAVPATTAPMANAVAPTADDHALGVTAPAPAPVDAASLPQETPAAAVLAPPTELALPVEQTKPDSELAPASIIKAAEDAAHKPDRKAAVSRTRRTRVVAGAYRTRWPRANGVAQFDTQYLNQDTAFAQRNFQTGPSFQTGPRQYRRAKDSSRPPEDATSVAGGPFVNPPVR